MSATVQCSIFDFQDRILPKTSKTIPALDWDGNEATIRTENALAIISAINGKLTTGGTWPRFMVQSVWSHKPDGSCDRVIGHYIGYWVHAEAYNCKVNHETGEIYDHSIRIKRPITKDGQYIDKGTRTPTNPRIEDGSFIFDCDDGNTYAMRIDDDTPVDRYDIMRFDPVNGNEASEHLLLHCFINGARGEELEPLMAYGPVFLNTLDGHMEQDCQIQDLARKYGIDLPMSQNVKAWAPEHYPNQEKCTNCTRGGWKHCQVVPFGGRPHTEAPHLCRHWHWDGTPFKKLAKKKRIPEDEEEEE